MVKVEVNARPVDGTAIGVGERPWATGYAWLRYPDFWLALALAAALRLWHLELTQFLDDQTYLMRLARGAFLHGALPVTGIPSSIGTLNPPLSVYLIMPFAAFTADPFPSVVVIALWNVVGVGLAYIFTWRYFGRWAAAAGALLFATSGAAINYSRFIWQQNYLPPVLALWAITLYAGVVRGQRRWFVAHALLLVVGILLHPIAAMLLPVTLLGLLLAPRSARPPLRSFVIVVGIVLLLLAPTLVWQAASGGSDIRTLAHYFTTRGSFSLDVFKMLYSALGALDPLDFGPDAPYAGIAPFYTLLNVGTAVFFALGVLALTLRVAAPLPAVWRASAPAGASWRARLRPAGLALWRRLRAEPVWRAHLLLWLTVVVPILAMVRHSNELFVHYLMVLYPFAFIVAGIGAVALAGWLRGPRLPALVTKALPAAVTLLVVLVVAGQAAEWPLYPASLASGRFAAYDGYGYPLAEVRTLDSALTTLQRDQRATSVYLSLPQDVRYRAPMEYLLLSERTNRTGTGASCLMLPAPGESPALLAIIGPASPASALAATLPNARPAGQIALAGAAPIPVYALSGAVPPLAGETALTGAAFVDASGNGLRLDAIAHEADGSLRLRWTVLGSADRPSGTPWYRVNTQAVQSDGTAKPLNRTECRPNEWRAGQTVFTWIPLGATPAERQAVQSVTLQVLGGTFGPRTVPFGPVTLLAGRDGGDPLAVLPATGAPNVTAQGKLVLPVRQLEG